MTPTKKMFLFATIALLATTSLAQAPYMNYQGVLRDASDNPLDGSYDMVFRFYGPIGEEFLVDQHLAAGTGAVTVTDGLFNVALGSGTVLDGSAPEIHNGLNDVFRHNPEVWLEIQIGADGMPGTEVLTPRVRVLSAAYAYESSFLDGKAANYFLDISTDLQTKAGPLYVLADTTPASNAIYARGTQAGGFFTDSDGSGQAYAGYGHVGVSGTGDDYGGFFNDSNESGAAWIGYGHLGISGQGSTAGAYFADLQDSGWAYLGYGNRGIHARGSEAGGYFFNNVYSGYAYVGYLDEGISAHGNVQGGYFQDDDSTGVAHVAYGDLGIDARGNHAGAYFVDSNGTGYAYVGYGNSGIDAQGTSRGGYFKDSNSSGYSYVGFGDSGIRGYGNLVGGFFKDLDHSGQAYVGYGDVGIHASGNGTGGYFEDTNASATAFVAVENIGIDARGTQAGGYFADTNGLGYAYIGNSNNGVNAGGDVAIVGSGSISGGLFESTGGTGYAYAGYYDRGISSFGTDMGGFFNDSNDLGYANVGFGGYKIQGNGAVSFVQNHPYDDSRVVVYTAPEGDEVATYTRGTARLVNGEARVALGETFAWVTNSDVGLTAHITPRSADAVVYVESVSTGELVVRNVKGFADDAAFDYLVYGLRIGFEERAVVQPKKQESYIPSMTEDREILRQEPELRAQTALERFKGMHADVARVDAGSIDFSESQALRNAIHQYDPATDPPVGELLGHDPGPQRGQIESTPRERPFPVAQATEDPAAIPATANSGSIAAVGLETDEDRPQTPIDTDRLFPVSEAVEAGDLLALDAERSGTLVRATSAQDPGIVGIAADVPVAVDGGLRVALVETNYAVLRADAGYGEIRAGDLLTSSFTPGHAMRAAEIVPGTIIGKALEPLQTGTGPIKVLVMPR